jgi:hypothetical protein
MIFDPAVIMIFDPAVNNKFDHAVIKDIRPPRQDSSTPAEPKASPDTLRPLRAETSAIFLSGVTPGENTKAKSSSTMNRLYSLLSVCFRYFQQPILGGFALTLYMCLFAFKLYICLFA